MLDHYPVDPAKLKAETGWHHSKNWNFEVSAITMNDHTEPLFQIMNGQQYPNCGTT